MLQSHSRIKPELPTMLSHRGHAPCAFNQVYCCESPAENTRCRPPHFHTGVTSSASGRTIPTLLRTLSRGAEGEAEAVAGSAAVAGLPPLLAVVRSTAL